MSNKYVYIYIYINIHIYHIYIFLDLEIVPIDALPHTQVGLYDGTQLDTIYGCGEPNVHMLFSFDKAVAGSHDFGHFTLLIPSHSKGGGGLQLDECVSWSSTLLNVLCIYIYIYRVFVSYIYIDIP